MAATLVMIWCVVGGCTSIALPQPVPWQACLIHGPLYAAEWQRWHPNFADHVLVRWTCRNGVET